MSKYIWEEVEWETQGQLLDMIINGANVYLSKGGNRYISYLKDSVDVCPFRIVINKWTAEPYDFDLFSGYIKKEADWTDVISEDNPIFLITKAGSIARYVCAPIENTKFRPARLNEVKKHVWECMQDE